MKSTRIALSSLVLCLLAACGGGGGGDPALSATTPAATPIASAATTIAGTVIDGYIEGATVCLDLNSNAACDANEPTTTSGSDGKYSISYAGSTSGLHVVSLIPSTAKDADDKGLTIAQAGKTAFTLMAPAPVAGATNTHVTPLTTLVSYQMTQSGTTDAKVAETQVQSNLGITTPLLNNDFKATTTAANTNSAQIAVAITNAISAAQSSLSTSASFQTAVGTTDKVKVQAAAQQAAVNLVAKTVAPSIVDKATGTLNTSVTASTVISSTQTVATNSSKSLAIESMAPKATSATVQAFTDGVIVGAMASGDYIDASGKVVNGNWSGYINALQINYLRGDPTTLLGSEKKLVLIGNKWFQQYVDGKNYYLTAKGWLIEDAKAQAVPKDDCMTLKYTASGPTQQICLTKFDYSGKKVTDLLTDPCTDNKGKLFPGCDLSTIFPASTYAYRLNMSFDQETYKMWVSTTWDGYGANMNPKQTTLEGWIKASIDAKTTHSIGDQCNTALNIATYDQTAQTGTIKFFDMSDFATDCNTVYSNLGKAKSSEVKSFKVLKINGEPVMLYQMPLIFIKSNPDDGRSKIGGGLFGSYNGKIFDGEYWPLSSKLNIGLDGNQKIGNKNLLDTFLKMTGQTAFPY